MQVPRVFREHLDAWIAFGLFLAALVLRLYGLGHEALWADEYFTLVSASQDSVGELLHHVRVSDPHPPLYFLLLYVTQLILPLTDVVLRLPSALAGAATIPAFFALGRTLMPDRRQVATISAGLLAVSPMHIYYSQEARAYALLVLLEVCSLLALLIAIRKESPRKLLWLTVACCFAVLAIYTHYYAVFFLLVFGIILLQLGGNQPTNRRLYWGTLALLCVLSIPSAWMALSTVRSGSGISWVPEFHLVGDLIPTLKAQFVGPMYSPLPQWLAMIGVAAGIVLCSAGLYRLRERDEVFPWWFVVGGLLATLALPILVALTVKPIMFHGQRYLIIALPFVLLSASLWKTRWLYVAFAILVTVQLGYLQNYYSRRQKQTWDTIAGFVENNSGKEVPVLCLAPYMEALLERYAQERDVVTLDAASFPEDLSEYRGRSFIFVSKNDQRPEFRRAGIDTERVAVAFFETARPSEALFVFVANE